MNVFIAVAGVPSGSVMLWPDVLGTIPAGWVRCDGDNGTEDMRDRMIMGIGTSYVEGSVGGGATHTHTVNQSGHIHPIAAGDAIAAGLDFSDETSKSDPFITCDTKSHIPPYRAHYWIMKT